MLNWRDSIYAYIKDPQKESNVTEIFKVQNSLNSQWLLTILTSLQLKEKDNASQAVCKWNIDVFSYLSYL